MPLAPAPLIYVMGPSGAGKDSILLYARTRLAPHEKIAFAHRYVTRASEAGGENHVALSRCEFEMRKCAGLFAFDWQAHDTCYGIGIEVQIWRRAGMTVVMNGSRKHFADLASDAGVIPVVITAPADILIDRLARRARENADEIRARVRREVLVPNDPSTIVIDNSGPLDVAGSRFLDVVRTLPQTPVGA